LGPRSIRWGESPCAPALRPGENSSRERPERSVKLEICGLGRSPISPFRRSSFAFLFANTHEDRDVPDGARIGDASTAICSGDSSKSVLNSGRSSLSATSQSQVSLTLGKLVCILCLRPFRASLFHGPRAGTLEFMQGRFFESPAACPCRRLERIGPRGIT
jgi:hypothetical protein